MRNRGAIWIFTILLVAACLYQLSFSWVTKGIESEAITYGEKQYKTLINSP